MGNIYDLTEFARGDFQDSTAEARTYLGTRHRFPNLAEEFPHFGNVWLGGRALDDTNIDGMLRFALLSWNNNRFIYCIDAARGLHHPSEGFDIRGKQIEVFGTAERNHGLMSDRPYREPVIRIGAIYVRSDDALIQKFYHSEGVLVYDTHKALALSGSRV
jgi:hypothetical protein